VVTHAVSTRTTGLLSVKTLDFNPPGSGKSGDKYSGEYLLYDTRLNAVERYQSDTRLNAVERYQSSMIYEPGL
jgi:hypothetical protein